MTLPKNTEIEVFARSLFQKNFIKVESSLSFKEVVDWVESSPNALSLFMRFGIFY